LSEDDLHASHVLLATIGENSFSIVIGPVISIRAEVLKNSLRSREAVAKARRSPVLAVSLATNSLAMMPDVLFWADLLKPRLGDVAPAFGIASRGGVHNGHVNICVDTIDWTSINIGGLAGTDDFLTVADITPELTLSIVGPLHKSTNILF